MLPFGFFASVGRGYLPPMGAAFLALLMANVVSYAGWGEYFPWAIPGLYGKGKSTLAPVSFLIVILTGLLGVIATYFVVEIFRSEPLDDHSHENTVLRYFLSDDL